MHRDCPRAAISVSIKARSAIFQGNCRRAFFEPAASLDLDACRTHWWLNLVFANNQHPVGGCYNITWSLAVQVVSQHRARKQ